MHDDVVAGLADGGLEVVQELEVEFQELGERGNDGAHERHALWLAIDLDPDGRRTFDHRWRRPPPSGRSLGPPDKVGFRSTPVSVPADHEAEAPVIRAARENVCWTRMPAEYIFVDEWDVAAPQDRV